MGWICVEIGSITWTNRQISKWILNTKWLRECSKQRRSAKVREDLRIAGIGER